jgi:hypothetical protein
LKDIGESYTWGFFLKELRRGASVGRCFLYFFTCLPAQNKAAMLEMMQPVCKHKEGLMASLTTQMQLGFQMDS